MKAEFDLSKMKSRRNPFASKLKKSVTMRLSEDVVQYFKAMAANRLVPISVIDLTPATIPYWELREKSSVASGIEGPFLTAYREGSFHYLLIAADRI